MQKHHPDLCAPGVLKRVWLEPITALPLFSTGPPSPALKALTSSLIYLPSLPSFPSTTTPSTPNQKSLPPAFLYSLLVSKPMLFNSGFSNTTSVLSNSPKHKVNPSESDSTVLGKGLDFGNLKNLGNYANSSRKPGGISPSFEPPGTLKPPTLDQCGSTTMHLSPYIYLSLEGSCVYSIGWSKAVFQTLQALIIVSELFYRSEFVDNWW